MVDDSRRCCKFSCHKFTTVFEKAPNAINVVVPKGGHNDATVLKWGCDALHSFSQMFRTMPKG